MRTEYYLGLDMGTGSTGWAVTNQNYELLKAHGKTLWGVRLFENAKTAADRRTHRISRRRLDRQQARIQLLQEIFDDEIARIDAGFFLRMKESKYYPEDKRDENGACPALPYALFVDTDYTDKDYHSQFPTIYHLRKYLMETEDTPDIRLVYLAFHHMMKHRGHFLFSGSIEEIKSFSATFQGFLDVVRQEELDLDVQERDFAAIEAILRDGSLTKSEKEQNLIKLLGAKTACQKALLKAITGGKTECSKFFGDDELKQIEHPSFNFSDAGYEEKKGDLEQELGERFVVVQWAKAVYDWSLLANILNDQDSISAAKVASYEKHRDDLARLKRLVRDKHGKKVYQEVFVESVSKRSNYPAYIGTTKNNGRKQPLADKGCNKDKFYTFLETHVLNSLGDDDEAKEILLEIKKGTFLPKQKSSENSTLPYQVHLYELNAILNNLESRIPLLAENGDKIRQIFTFHIPYYIGPLNGISKGETRTNWAVRKSTDKIYPWNFDDVIDREKSAEAFILRMTNKCTYLPREDVLPRFSVLYSRFMVLNELNNLRLDGQEIPVSVKQKIFQDVFCRHRKVTQKRLKDYLIREGLCEPTVDITGIDGDFKASLTACHDFKRILSGITLTLAEQESLIRDITLFGADKTLLKQRVSARFPQLTDKQKTAICNLPYKGWGRFSKAFLCDVYDITPETGEARNILEALWQTNDNLMQLLSSKYGFARSIEEKTTEHTPQTLNYGAIDALAVSSPVKRSIWQTLQIVRELCQVMGGPPTKIFVEMAREDRTKGRTVSRKERLEKLYKACKQEERNWIAELKELKEHQLRRDKLYLYYTQMGKCMYTGEAIPLEDLWNDNKYDIDHIYPQSKVMDDSLNNRVLVRKKINAEKSDGYPIKEEIRSKMRPYWNYLLEKGLIEKEKYYRLTRATGFSNDELSGFIARQIVETQQATKAAASILKQVFPDSEIVYAKAKAVAQFRQDFDFIKVRDLNDLHHAKDAYLNIVVGNVYYTKFTKNAAWFVKNNPGRSYNLKKLFEQGVVERNGETAWVPPEERDKEKNTGTIRDIRRVMNKNNILVTRQSYEETGELFKEMPLKKGKGQVPLKGSDSRLAQIEKYGGYNNATGAYFVLVESEDKKGNLQRTIECIPCYLKNQVKTEAELQAYLAQSLSNPRVLLPKIKINTLVKVDGFPMWLSGRSNDSLLIKGAVQLVLGKDESKTLKKVLKFVQRQKDNKKYHLVAHDDLTKESLLGLYDVFLEKLRSSIYAKKISKQEKTLSRGRDTFQHLDLEEQCMVLAQILNLFQCNAATADLRAIGGPEEGGKLTLNKTLDKKKPTSIVHQSITGIFENEIDLLTI